MSDSLKQMSERDAQQVQKFIFNEEDKSIATNGFLVGKIGRKITQAISQTTVPGDTATLTFLENGVTLYVYEVIYTDASQSVLLSAERIA